MLRSRLTHHVRSSLAKHHFCFGFIKSTQLLRCAHRHPSQLPFDDDEDDDAQVEAFRRRHNPHNNSELGDENLEQQEEEEEVVVDRDDVDEDKASTVDEQVQLEQLESRLRAEFKELNHQQEEESAQQEEDDDDTVSRSEEPHREQTDKKPQTQQQQAQTHLVPKLDAAHLDKDAEDDTRLAVRGLMLLHFARMRRAQDTAMTALQAQHLLQQQQQHHEMMEVQSSSFSSSSSLGPFASGMSPSVIINCDENQVMW